MQTPKKKEKEKLPDLKELMFFWERDRENGELEQR